MPLYRYFQMPARNIHEYRGGSEVEIVSYESERIEIHTWNPGRGFLVASESWDKNWRATIDGKPTLVCRTNGVARGLIVLAGDHEIVMTYRPRCALASFAVSGVGWLLVIGLCMVGMVRNRGPKMSVDAEQGAR